MLDFANYDNRKIIPMLNTITVGDSRELSKDIPDESIDLIFTDPPYLQVHIEDAIYEWLAEEAARVLKPGGFCLAYVGNMWKDRVMHQMGEYLTYYWDYVSMGTGYGIMIWSHKVIARHKSILAFVKGNGKPRYNSLSVWTGSGQDKRFHAWGQDESTARYFIDCFSSPQSLIWEPFTGGGTTPAMCKQLGRNFIAFEIDSANAQIARKRLTITQPFLISEKIDTLSLWEAL